MKSKKQKAIIAMSGGVDSSVAAKIIKDQGFETMGIFLHFWKPPYAKASGGEPLLENYENKCCSAKAFMDARKVCQEVGIKLYTLNFAKEFKKDIVDNFISEYKTGNTPNPCVRCNKLVKLGLLIKRAKKLGYEKIASGHYVKLKKIGGKYKLYKAKDKDKDQSYFLWALTQEQLSHLLFPLGNFTKPEVRKLAKKYKLPVAEKKESQEVCFIPGKSHNEFLKKYVKLKAGPIISLTPSPSSPDLKSGRRERVDLKAPLIRGVGGLKIIGKHQGLPLYTIGQRRGIEIGGTGPYYAAGFDYKKNILYVVNNFDDPALYKDELITKDINWISGTAPKTPLKCEAVIRYRHKPVECEVASPPAPLLIRRGVSKPSADGERCLVKFKEPQRAITPGQSIVFYKGDEVLGGGVIV
jgi:tRNA-specific 2-thiouridylase